MEYMKYIFNKRFGKLKSLFNPVVLFVSAWITLILTILIVSGQI